MHGWPVSRILSRQLPALDDHSSAPALTDGIQLPTRASRAEASLRRYRADPTCPARGPYSALLRAGLAMPFLLPGPRWALTPPFHHHRTGLRPRPAARLSLLCCAFPRVTPAGSYPAPLLHGVRTFLGTTLARPPRSSGHPCEAGLRPLPGCRQAPSAEIAARTPWARRISCVPTGPRPQGRNRRRKARKSSSGSCAGL
ncbi:hypothetical protein SAMN05519105_1156 [Rhodobacter sp. 24-YEA-8]|nr:hypothetical protein SAMN05519105_1156 [Rhodobacter sp. 24-YEA-8]